MTPATSLPFYSRSRLGTRPWASGVLPSTGPSGSADRAQVLDQFGVPSARFDASGRVVSVSASARELLGSSLEELLHEASALVARLLEGARMSVGAPQPTLVLPSHDGLTTLRAQMTSADEGDLIFVLFLAARRSPVEEPASSWGLSTRQIDVATLIATGVSTKAIAARLGISIHTARRHTERVFAKLGVQSRAQVVLLLRGTCRSAPLG
jgi:DNA-binding CsgD family transcriptional regulator